MNCQALQALYLYSKLQYAEYAQIAQQGYQLIATGRQYELEQRLLQRHQKIRTSSVR